MSLRKLKVYKKLAILGTVIFFGLAYFIFGTKNYFLNEPLAVAAGNNCTAIASTNWNLASTWSGCNSDYPRATDNATVGAGFTVTIPTGYTIETIGNLTIAGTLTQSNTATQTISGTLTVQSGGILNHCANDTTQACIVNFDANAITVDTGGSINVASKGYTTNNGTGKGALGSFPNGSGSGAGHGGNGGTGAAVGGSAYCDITNPATIGSGGGGAGGYGGGGSGGGFVKLTVTNALTLNGSITAAGGAGGGGAPYGGGGSGGGLNITAGSIAGTPTAISIVGGAAGGNTAGGAGGGCALFNYTTTNTIVPTSSIFVMGGGAGGVERGGAGVVYIKQVGTGGDLYSINTGSGAGSNQVATTVTANSFSVATSSDYIVPSGKTLVLNNVSPFAGGNSTGRVKIQSGATFTPTTSPSFTVANGILLLYSGSTFTASSTLDLIVGSGGTFSLGSYTTSTSALNLNTVTVQSGGIVTHEANTTAQSNILKLTTAGNFTVNSGGSVNIGGKGYASDGGPGAGVQGTYPNGKGGGAGHGGAGGASSEPKAGGAAYCTTSSPATIGSGGGSISGYTAAGGAGGGLAILNVGNIFTVNGSVMATGTTGGASNGGGAGGAINVLAVSVAGTPTAFSVAGGNGGANGGGGGGGCILITYQITNTVTSSLVSLVGGTGANSGSTGVAVFTVLTPSAPAILYSANTDASAGSINPTTLASLTPVFSAPCSSPTGQCTLADIEVDDTSDFSSPIWQSSNINIVDINSGIRSESIPYAGSQLKYNTTYYWRIKFYNSVGTGAWSIETATFYVPRALELVTFNAGGSVFGGSSQSISWHSVGGSGSETVKLEYSNNNFSTASTISASESSVSSTNIIRSYTWSVPNAQTICGADTCNTVKIRISANQDGNNYIVDSEDNFTVQSTIATGIKTSRTFSNSNFYTPSSSVVFSNDNAIYVVDGVSTKYKALTVTNAVASTLTEYQVRIPVVYDADMQTDFDDIRFFADADQLTALNFWRESKTDSVSSTFWVKIPSLPASSSATIYMFYGNASAVNGSSVSSTFLFGDDFDGSSLVSGWTEVNLQGSAVGTLSSGQWTKTCNGECDWWNSSAFDAGAYIDFPTNSGSDMTWEAITQLQTGSLSGNKHYGIMLYQAATDGYMFGKTPSGGANYYEGAITGAGNQCNFNLTALPSYLKISKVTAGGIGSNSTYQFWYSTDGGSWTRCGAYAPTDIMSKVGLFLKDWDSTASTVTFNNFYVKKYASTEPSVSAGSEVSLTFNDQIVDYNAGNYFGVVSGFVASTTVTGSAEIRFQFSGNDGVDWKYCVGDTLVDATLGYTHTNTAVEITDLCLANLSAGGTFRVKSYLRSGTSGSATLSRLDYLISTNNAPSVSAIFPAQLYYDRVTVTTTIADTDSNSTNLIVLYSTDGNTWSSSTIHSVDEGGEGDGVTTSSGYISGIDTNVDGSINLTFYWNLLADLPDTTTNTVYLKINPNDGTVDGTTVSSTVFSIDTVTPASPIITDPAVVTTTVESASYTVIGTAEDNSTVWITGGSSTANGTATGGNFSVLVPLNTDATNYLSAVAVDAVGNTSTAVLFDIIQQSTSSYHFVITGNNNQIAGTDQVITITLKSGAGTTISSYTGDKNIILSGPSTAQNGTHPTCSDKNSADVNFGVSSTLTFLNGVATCSLKLYASENISIDATDSTFTSLVDPTYDLDVMVSVGDFAVLSLQTPISALSGTEFQVTSTLKDFWWNIVTSTIDDSLVTISAGSVSPTSIASNGYAVTGILNSNLTITAPTTEISNIILTLQNGSAIATSSIAVVGMPADPSSVSGARSTDSQFVITWQDNSTVESGYIVERNTDSGSGWDGWVQIGTVSTSTAIYNDTTTVVDQRYQYRVKAIGQGTAGDSGYSTDAQIHYTTPDSATNVVGTRSSDTQFAISYADNAAVTDWHIVERCDNAGCDATYVSLDGSPFSASPASDLTTVANSRYRWQVAGQTPSSSPENLMSTYASSNYEYTTPSAPTNVASVRLSDSQISVSWTDSSAYEDGFRIEASIDSGSFFEVTPGANTVGAGIDTVVINTSTVGHSFNFKVRAHVGASANNSELLSDYADAVGISYGRPAAPSSIIAARINDNLVTVDWASSMLADIYKLWIKEDNSDWVEAMTPANVLTYGVTAVSPNHAYLFKVNAFREILESDFVTTTNPIYTTPASPSSITPTYVSDNQIDLAWVDASSYEEGFIVRMNDNSSGWQAITSTGANTTVFSVDTSLVDNHLYQFDIASFIGSVTSTPTESINIYTTPSAPSNVSTTINANTINVNWVDNSAYEAGFIIEVSVDGSGYTVASTTGSDVVLFDYTTSTVDHYYQIRTKSYRDALNSSYSTSSIIFGPLSAPTNVSAVRISDAQINLSWTDNSASESGYIVEMRQDGGAWSTVSTTATNVESVNIVSGISANHTYELRVKSFNSDTSSEYVSASEIIYTTPSAPSDLLATYISDTQINLSWTDNSGSVEEGFRIENKIDDGSWAELTLNANTVNANINSYSYTSSANHKYEFRIRSASGALLSTYANTLDAVYTTPNAPTAGIANYVSDNQIDLSWVDNSNYEEGFKVQYQVDDGVWQLVTTTSANINAYSFVDGTQNHKYTFRIYGYNGSNNSDYALIDSIYTSLIAPTIGSVTVNSATGITWSWVNNSSYAESSYLHVYNNGTDSLQVVTGTSRLVTVLPNTEYLAQVSSYRSDRGESALSASSTAVYSLANIPSSVALTANQTEIIASWNTNNNSIGTEYYAENTTLSTNSGWITNSSWTASSLTCNTPYTFIVKSKNNDGIQTSSTAPVSLTTSACDQVSQGGGGGSSVSFSNSLMLPGPSSENLSGNFAVKINNDATEVDMTNVVLQLFGGPDAVRMAISNTADFNGVSQEPYGLARTWILTNGDGLKTVYVKFFNNRGVSSPVVSADIMLDTAPPRISVDMVPTSFDREQAIVINGTTKPKAVVKAIFGENKIVTTTANMDGSWQINLPALVPGFYPLRLEAKDQLGRISLPAIVPIVIRKEIIFPIDLDFPLLLPITSSTDLGVVTTTPNLEDEVVVSSTLSLKPLPNDLIMLINKLPQLKNVLADLSIKTMADVSRLSSASIYLPTLSSLGLSNKIDLVFSAIEQKSVPTEVVFFKNAGGSIDIQPILNVNQDGQVNQIISSITGKQITLIVKPADNKPVLSVKGRIVFKSRPASQNKNEQRSVSVLQQFFMTPFAKAEEIDKNTEFLMQEFDYTDTKKTGIYTASIITPAVDGTYDIITEIEYKDKQASKTELRTIMLVDPEGYVFERVGDQELRIKNAKVSLFWLNPDNNKFELWSADKYLQKNPVLTDVTGRYAFLSPNGTYYLQVEARDYVTYKGEEFLLSEENQIHLNIEMSKPGSASTKIDKYKWYIFGGSAFVLLIMSLIVNLILIKRKKNYVKNI